MSIVLPGDVDNRYDDLSQFAAMLRGTSKPLVVSNPQAGDSLPAMQELAAVCGSGTSLACLVMPSPPLRYENDALDKIMVCADRGIPVIVAPAPSAGTTAPASIAATVAVGTAEVLAGLVVHQVSCPGAPFTFGVGAARTHMRSAVDAYFLPEHFLGNQAACDLVRSYGLPSWGYAGISDSKALNEQWTAEAAVTTVLGGLSRATLLHDVGYLESGMQGSYESLLFGNEMVGYARALMRPVPVDEQALALDEIAAAGPGGNHLASNYTRRHYRRPGTPTSSTSLCSTAGARLEDARCSSGCRNALRTSDHRRGVTRWRPTSRPSLRSGCRSFALGSRRRDGETAHERNSCGAGRRCVNVQAERLLAARRSGGQSWLQ